MKGVGAVMPGCTWEFDTSAMAGKKTRRHNTNCLRFGVDNSRDWQCYEREGLLKEGLVYKCRERSKRADCLEFSDAAVLTLSSCQYACYTRNEAAQTGIDISGLAIPRGRHGGNDKLG